MVAETSIFKPNIFFLNTENIFNYKYKIHEVGVISNIMEEKIIIHATLSAQRRGDHVTSMNQRKSMH